MRLFFILFALLYFSEIRGQSQDSVIFKNKPKRLVSVSPLNLMNRFPTVFLHYETHLVGNMNVSMGGGVVVNLEDDAEGFDRNFLNRRGFKLNNEYKYYFEGSEDILISVSLMFEYFNVKFDRARTFGFDCSNSRDCSYYQFREYAVTRQQYRVGAKSSILTKVGKRFIAEAGLGVVWDVRNYSHSGRLEGFDVQFGDTRLQEEGSDVNILPIPHLKFGYLIR